MVDDEKITEYTLAQVRIENFPPFYCDGMKITDDRESELKYHGASRKPFQRTQKKEKIEWEMLEPRDHASLHRAHQLCKNEGKTFTMTILAQNNKGEWKVMERLDDCDIPGIERTIGNFEAIKLSIKGTALDREVITTEFE